MGFCVPSLCITEPELAWVVETLGHLGTKWKWDKEWDVEDGMRQHEDTMACFESLGVDI